MKVRRRTAQSPSHQVEPSQLASPDSGNVTYMHNVYLLASRPMLLQLIWLSPIGRHTIWSVATSNGQKGAGFGRSPLRLMSRCFQLESSSFVEGKKAY